MKKTSIIIPAFLLSFVSFSQTATPINLHNLVDNKGIEVYNRNLTLIKEDGHLGIRLSKDEGEGVAWLKGVEISNAIVEFDVRGEDVKQHSFVGIAFHGVDNNTFDAVYLRPFNFRSPDIIARSHSIQYISLPEFTWRTLRETFPDKYENSIFPMPDPNAWIRFRIVITDTLISTFIDGSTDPVLVVKKLTGVKSGHLGFYVADTSGGDFANLIITRTN
jgi:hypothetical protein